ncbi:HET-domain-containing protein, partial [Stipitochalara longipes BDJ]
MLAVRRIGSQIDFDLVQHWIKSCNAHGEACSKQIKVGQRVSSRIRLVDVKRKRLVWMTTSETYAVLSYMWGPPSLEQARLTRSTHAGLFLDGALAYDNDTIPRTIRDAMAVCERLGIPNLWVDALCIEQDSSDFNVHLHMMNDIYAAAYLTIVTACGAESWNGLSGVRPGSREVYQPSIIIDDMEIGLAVQEFWTSVMHSPWANRGWTFQERLFSRRMLIFADTQCFFYCDKLSRFESTITEVDEEDMRIEHRFLYPHLWVDDRRKLFISKNMRLNSVQLDYLKDSLLDYFQLFRNHRRLSLTYQADVLRAFWGVTATYEQRMSSAFYFGMPLSLFTLALLLGCTQCTRRPSFPSWCWAGWS